LAIKESRAGRASGGYRHPLDPDDLVAAGVARGEAGRDLRSVLLTSLGECLAGNRSQVASTREGKGPSRRGPATPPMQPCVSSSWPPLISSFFRGLSAASARPRRRIRPCAGCGRDCMCRSSDLVGLPRQRAESDRPGRRRADDAEHVSGFRTGFGGVPSVSHHLPARLT
jgi:hypothetical protein